MRILLAVAVLCVAACGGEDARLDPGPAGPPDVSRASFAPEAETVMLALLTGTLGGDRATGCLWVEGAGQRQPLVLQHDTAVLDTSVEPPVVRDGDRVLAAFGDEVEVGGGNDQVPAAACPELGERFLGHGLTRSLPGEPPVVALSDLRRACGPADGPALGLTATVEGVPRMPLTVQVHAHPAGTLLGTAEVPPQEGDVAVLVPFDDAFAPLPDEVLVTVSEGAQALAQALADPRPGPACG